LYVRALVAAEREPIAARLVTRTSVDRSALLLVQDLQEFLDPFERLVVPVAGVDHAIAIARQRFRLGFAQSAGQERRRDGLRSDVESHDTPTLAIDPKLRRRKEIARRRRQPAETARGFFFQILQLVFAPTPGDASIASLN